MYLSEKQKSDLKKQGILRGDEVCAMCSNAPDIFWNLGAGALFLCGEHAQYLGTHLLKDVRSYESATNKTVKVRTETRGHLDWNLT